MLPITPSVGKTQAGKQAYSFVSSYFSFKQNLMCPLKGGNLILIDAVPNIAENRIITITGSI